MALFLTHVNNILERLRQDKVTTISTDPASVAFRCQTAVQRAIARVWNAKQWTFKQASDTLAITAASTLAGATYSLPKRVGDLFLVTSTVSPYKINPKSQDDFKTRIPNPVSIGNPTIFTQFEYVGVDQQPSSASIISVSSNSSADITQKVRIRGVVNNEEDVEEITLVGTTAVLTTKSFSVIHSVSKSAATAGKVTVTSNSGAVTVVALGPLETVLRLKKITAYPFPASAAVWTLNHFKLPFIPSADNDDSDIPARWDYVVEQWAFALALQPQGQDQISEQTTQFTIAQQYLDVDMASEERQGSDGLIQPNRGLDDGPDNNGYLNDASGRGFEEGYL
jgi:hypothetical protein